MNKNKKIINSILIFLFFTVFATLINLNNQDFSYDRIWLFHMMQKIANGELIYTEINVLVGPMFYILGGIIFKIFGANFIVYDIFGGLLYGVFGTIMYRLVKEINIHQNKIINLIMLIVIAYFAKFFSLASYNILTIIFIMLAMLIEIRKAKNKGNKYSNLLIRCIFRSCFFYKTNGWWNGNNSNRDYIYII